MDPEVRLFTVHGRVQGVWFRDSTRNEARRLGITGYAINQPDGNVEVLAYGSASALHKLEAWLQVGPPLARVTRVVAGKAPTGEVACKRPPTEFSIG